MKTRTALVILLFFTIGCRPALTVDSQNIIAENNKDVLVLTTLVRDYLRTTNGREFNLHDLKTADTLQRITHNFEKVELDFRPSYIAINYKFSDSRDNKKVTLNEKESELKNNLKWIMGKPRDQFDGQIQFDYGERFYRIRKIIAKDQVIDRK